MPAGTTGLVVLNRVLVQGAVTEEMPKNVRAVLVASLMTKAVGRVDPIVVVGRIPEPSAFWVVVFVDNEIEASTGVRINVANKTPTNAINASEIKRDRDTVSGANLDIRHSSLNF